MNRIDQIIHRDPEYASTIAETINNLASDVLQELTKQEFLKKEKEEKERREVQRLITDFTSV